MHSNGWGVPQDKARAAVLLQQAADQGHPAALAATEQARAEADAELLALWGEGEPSTKKAAKKKSKKKSKTPGHAATAAEPPTQPPEEALDSAAEAEVSAESIVVSMRLWE